MIRTVGDTAELRRRLLAARRRRRRRGRRDPRGAGRAPAGAARASRPRSSSTRPTSPASTAWGEPFLLGPGSIHVAHTAEERVAKRQLVEAADLYAELVRRLCGGAGRHAKLGAMQGNHEQPGAGRGSRAMDGRRSKIEVGILGATGTVGQRFVQLLADHPWFELRLAGGERPQRRQALRRGCQLAARRRAAAAHRRARRSRSACRGAGRALVFSSMSGRPGRRDRGRLRRRRPPRGLQLEPLPDGGRRAAAGAGDQPRAPRAAAGAAPRAAAGRGRSSPTPTAPRWCW